PPGCPPPPPPGLAASAVAAPAADSSKLSAATLAIIRKVVEILAVLPPVSLFSTISRIGLSSFAP
ncbi:MAG: hypothetical protein WBD33_20660, partial [Xanthobacteraceae bacterium]